MTTIQQAEFLKSVASLLESLVAYEGDDPWNDVILGHDAVNHDHPIVADGADPEDADPGTVVPLLQGALIYQRGQWQYKQVWG